VEKLGQRSQIYVRGFDRWNKKAFLVARYFQWNYAERMISRARGGIEWIKAHSPYISVELPKLNRIWDVNFDMHDICISTDLIEEYKQYGCDIFDSDNNDGKLFIDIITDEDGNVTDVKYCFTDWDNKYLGDGETYIKWESESYRDEVKDTLGLDEGRLNTLHDNLKYLKENATLMTEDNLKDIINYPYVFEEPKF
jgi:hypothetical protein